jgi:hypothetical protein
MRSQVTASLPNPILLLIAAINGFISYSILPVPAHYLIPLFPAMTENAFARLSNARVYYPQCSLAMPNQIQAYTLLRFLHQSMTASAEQTIT